MEIQHLHYFIHLARTGSVSQSAKDLSLSQPSLSRHIQQLEAYLNVSLFDRNYRPMKLTEAGEFLYQQLQQPIQEIHQAFELTKQFNQKQHSQCLTIGFVASILYGLLPEIISQLRQQLKQQHPDFDIRLIEMSSEQQINALKSGEIDVGFGRIYHHDSSIRQLFLRNEKFVVALPLLHPLAKEKTAIKLSSLVNEHFILYHKSLNPVQHLQQEDPLLQLFEQQHLQVKSYVKVRDIQIALGLVAASEGITLVPESLKNVRNEQICYLPVLDDVSSPIFINLLTHIHHPMLAELQQAILKVYQTHHISYTAKLV